MNKSFFVVGTDTNVGKTYISALLCNQLSYNYLKLIQCGLIRDVDYVSNLIGREKIIDSCYEFKTPSSPHYALEIENIKIDIKKINKTIQENKFNTIIECAGGLLTPVDRLISFTDIVSENKIDAILVSHGAVGAINQVLSAVVVLDKFNINLVAIVLSGDISFDNYDFIKSKTQHSVFKLEKNSQVIDENLIKLLKNY
jgi:dethiobiotin synthetase